MAVGYMPKQAPLFMLNVYRKIFPAVKKELKHWECRASDIPDDELRAQAKQSIRSKRFHCQGGAVFAMLAGKDWRLAVKFIVSYQTISDYLDNLCDRSTSLDPDDFRALHEGMEDALCPDRPIKDYYRHRDEKDDGGYLTALIRSCREVIVQIPAYESIVDYLLILERRYTDLQIHKHVRVEEREQRLKQWHESHKQEAPGLEWYEFSAAAGSTLGIFSIIAYSFRKQMNASEVELIFDGYFPYMQGLHIMLDYYIDQEEDMIAGDLNFCAYYRNRAHMHERFFHFMEEADKNIQMLPDKYFHQFIRHGLIGLYLADPKVAGDPQERKLIRSLLQGSGWQGSFFHWNTKLYHLIAKQG